jgi:hypothetical protein
MAKLRIQLPQFLRENDTFLVKDAAWAFFFPRYWFSYRQKASLRNATKIKVVSSDGDDKYTIVVMEIAPEEGRIVIPDNMKTQTTLREIHIALIATYKSELN